MSKFELIYFPDEHGLADGVAGRWLDELNSRDTTRSYHVALSGGRIARRFFMCVVERWKQQPSSLGQVHFFWADERCVPPTDPESNFSIAQRHLLSPLPIKAGQIHRMPGELEEKTAVAHAEAEICRIVPRNQAGQPLLDLVFLGMGEDGHVASLFPGESEKEMASRSIYRPVVATKPPPVRITIGYGAIAAARQVWVLASGVGKESSLKESLAPNGKTPLARVIALRPRTQIFTDIKIT